MREIGYSILQLQIRFIRIVLPKDAQRSDPISRRTKECEKKIPRDKSHDFYLLVITAIISSIIVGCIVIIIVFVVDALIIIKKKLLL
jgi:hypothetical protein